MLKTSLLMLLVSFPKLTPGHKNPLYQDISSGKYKRNQHHVLRIFLAHWIVRISTSLSELYFLRCHISMLNYQLLWLRFPLRSVIHPRPLPDLQYCKAKFKIQVWQIIIIAFAAFTIVASKRSSEICLGRTQGNFSTSRTEIAEMIIKVTG